MSVRAVSKKDQLVVGHLPYVMLETCAPYTHSTPSSN